MPTKTTRDMSDRHEATLAEALGGRGTKNSGATWNDPTDGLHQRQTQAWAFAWDGKSTLAKSISVSLDAWRKVTEQAYLNIPMLPLRFYLNARLTQWVDLVVVELDAFAEMREEAVKYRAIQEAGCTRGEHRFVQIEKERSRAHRERYPEAVPVYYDGPCEVCGSLPPDPYEGV